jgi:antitoxin CptB
LDCGAGDVQLRRARWRCRRGLQELDLLLERFCRTQLPGASCGERDQFEALLGLPDPLLAGYLLGGLTPQGPAMARLVSRIRSYVA